MCACVPLTHFVSMNKETELKTKKERKLDEKINQ